MSIVYVIGNISGYVTAVFIVNMAAVKKPIGYFDWCYLLTSRLFAVHSLRLVHNLGCVSETKRAVLASQNSHIADMSSLTGAGASPRRG